MQLKLISRYVRMWDALKHYNLSNVVEVWAADTCAAQTKPTALMMLFWHLQYLRCYFGTILHSCCEVRYFGNSDVITHTVMQQSWSSNTCHTVHTCALTFFPHSIHRLSTSVASMLPAFTSSAFSSRNIGLFSAKLKVVNEHAIVVRMTSN